MYQAKVPSTCPRETEAYPEETNLSEVHSALHQHVGIQGYK